MLVIPSSEIVAPLRAYAERVHAAGGSGHHVASPLGAWLLVAMASPAAKGALRDELATVLGMDVDAAGAMASRIMSAPHPAIRCATAFWTKAGRESETLATYLADLPVAVERGTIPSQERADAWARDRTMGLISQFPIAVTPTMDMVLANALATKVSWYRPFNVGLSTSLGDASAWPHRVQRVLETPDDTSHLMFITRSERAGEVAAHAVRANERLVVVSVIAEPNVKCLDVMHAAYDIAIKVALDQPIEKRSLYDLPLGATPMWQLTERSTRHFSEAMLEEYVGFMPTWSAASTHDLTSRDFGTAAAAEALVALIPAPLESFVAAQSAMAKFTRTGFEAAAVTSLGMTGAAMPNKVARLRVAELRFGHPYACVAVAVQPADWDVQKRAMKDVGPWHGLPVFSAWVCEPDETAPVDEHRLSGEEYAELLFRTESEPPSPGASPKPTPKPIAPAPWWQGVIDLFVPRRRS